MVASDEKLLKLRDRLRVFAADRNWDQFHNPKNLAMALIAEAGELVDQRRDPVGILLVETHGGSVECEDRRLRETFGDLLTHEETMVTLVGVEVEVPGEFVVPVDLDSDGTQGV